MHQKLGSSLIRLQGWVENVLLDGKKAETDITDFIAHHDLNGLKRFYDELIPFVSALADELPQTRKLVDQYKENSELLNKELARRQQRFWLDSIFSPFMKFRLDKLLSTLEDVKSNLGNIIYQIKINSS